MIDMDGKQMEIMEKIHRVQLKLLIEFDRLCRKYKIKYYIAAGTLLGAVRHKDFIPWDDDIDIYLKRKDYKAFLAHAHEFKYPFEVHVPTPRDDFFWDYTTRLVYKESKLKFNDEENAFYHHQNNEYLFLDIFVLDKTYSGIRNAIQLGKLKMIYGMAMSRRYTINYSDYPSFFSKSQVFILSHIGKLFRMATLYNAYERESVRYNNAPKAKYEQPTNITVKFLGTLFYKCAWHQRVVELEIRKHKFLAPKEYKKILKTVYGDYMCLPPEDKRKPEHIGVLDEIQIEEKM